MRQTYYCPLSGRLYTVKRRPLGENAWLIHWKESGRQPETWKEWSDCKVWPSPKAAELDLEAKAKKLHWQMAKPGQKPKGDRQHWIPWDTGRRRS